MTKMKTSADICLLFNLLLELKEFNIIGNSNSSIIKYFKLIK